MAKAEQENPTANSAGSVTVVAFYSGDDLRKTAGDLELHRGLGADFNGGDGRGLRA